MNYINEYKRWLLNADEETKNELSQITDKKEIEDRFYRQLEFGTGGIRGIIGAGTNRINKYIVARATKGLAEFIKKNSKNLSSESVVIAYDCRNFSKEFAHTASNVLCSNGIKTYIFDDLRPTPELSFAVRHLSATAGIVITASHNPAKYNGYKVYWSDGGQVPPDIASGIFEEILKIDFFDVTFDLNTSLQTVIGKSIDDAYIESVYAQSVNPYVHKLNFKLVYTPLHGSGNKPVRRILERAGFKNVFVVKEQEEPDGNFPTVASPNPENKECFEYAIKLAKENDVDLIIGTDPDSDRVGVVVRNATGEYEPLTGNQVGILLLNYILSSMNCTSKDAVVSTIVSTRMAKVVADYYGVTYFATLTGFKYIGEKIHEFEMEKSHDFVFGFEESYGYLKGTYCRDKDAVIASMLISEMAAYYQEKGKTLCDALAELYEKHGAFSEELVSITLEGADGLLRISNIMKNLRKNPPEKIGDFKITNIVDYLGTTNLPKSDVLYFELENDIHFAIRPSGTEPKIKLYYLSKADTLENADRKIEMVKKIISNIIS
ncbi:MAG: phospho-sugar mutase [Firmicutes bacterium]|nr:phospho-sugar mutase [Bacillota bacterium]